MAESLVNGASYGDHRYEFVDEIPVELICKVCTGVLLEPHLTSCCWQHYCKDCLGKKTVCPHCHKPDFRHFLDLKVQRKAMALRVRCTNRKHGCLRMDAISDMEVHFKICSYSLTVCNCRERILRQNLVQHLLDVCPLRHHRCEYCGLSGTYSFITGQHLKDCSDLSVKCPNLCQPNSFIKPNELEKHLSRCPLERVDCMYQAVGCTARALKADQGHHLRTHLDDHTSLLIQSMQQSMAAVITETELLPQLPAHMHGVRNTSLECIKTITGTNSSELKANSQTLTFRVNNYSELKWSGRHWRSLEFSVDGFKMHLVVVAKGIGDGRGTHLSIFLESRRLDIHSCWSEGVLGVELKPQSEEKMFVGSFWLVNAKRIPWKDLEAKDGLPVRLDTCTRFVTHEDLQCGMLLNDSLVFRVQRVKIT